MKLNYTNETGLRLPIMAWLLSDTYDFKPKEKEISATGLITSPKSTVLSRQTIAEGKAKIDVQRLVASRMGTAVHDSIERAWLDTERRKAGLDFFNIPHDQVEINPVEPTKNKLQIYMEIRSFFEFRGWKIFGKFDLICNGVLEDYKNTSTYKWTADPYEYRLQASIYRKIFPELITKDFFFICFVFKDFKQGIADKTNDITKYPDAAVKYKKLEFFSDDELYDILNTKIDALDGYATTQKIEVLPPCTPKELWMEGETVYKYYPKGYTASGKAYRTTANGDLSLGDLKKMKSKAKDPKATIKAFPPLAMKCSYCFAKDGGCEQYLSLKAKGLTKEPETK